MVQIGIDDNFFQVIYYLLEVSVTLKMNTSCILCSWGKRIIVLKLFSSFTNRQEEEVIRS